MAAPGKVLIIVENLPVPFDRRVWMEATTLRDNGYQVTVICPARKGYEALEEVIEGITIYRHPLPEEGKGAVGYLREYSAALYWEFRLAWKTLWRQGFDVIHACNPPDLIFLVGGFFKYLMGKRFIFDHHDLCPELYIAKFGRKDFFYRMLSWAERLTFAVADVSIATNHSYSKVAIERGKMSPDDVFVVRSGPNLVRFQPVEPNQDYKEGRKYLVGYVGVMGEQEGIDSLLRSIHHIVYTLGRRDITFNLIGSGPSYQELQELCTQLNLDKYVRFTGRVSDEELRARLSTCDLCVNPDPVNELNDKSTMNKIMEYMAMAKPVVQYDCTEGRYSAQEASVYAEPFNETDFASQIVELLGNHELRERMGEYGRRRMEQELEWRHQIPTLLRAYATALARR